MTGREHPLTGDSETRKGYSQQKQQEGPGSREVGEKGPWGLCQELPLPTTPQAARLWAPPEFRRYMPVGGEEGKGERGRQLTGSSVWRLGLLQVGVLGEVPGAQWGVGVQ